MAWAGCAAFVLVCATAETEFVHRVHHRQCAACALRLTLRKEAELRNLRGHEQHGGSVFAGSDTGATADGGRSVHREVGIFPSGPESNSRQEQHPRTLMNIGLLNLVEGGTVGDEALTGKAWRGTARW